MLEVFLLAEELEMTTGEFLFIGNPEAVLGKYKVLW